MKILHICSYYSGTTLYQKFINSLDKYETSNLVYVPITQNQKLNIKPNENLFLSQCINKFDRVRFYHKHRKILRDIKSKICFDGFDYIHAHTLFTDGYIAYKIMQNYNIPYIVVVRNTDLNIFLKYMIHLRKTGIEILKKAKRIIFLSDSYKTTTIDKYIPIEYKKDILGKSIVIPNGIDKFWLENKNSSLIALDQRTVNLLYVGDINRNKNVSTTIRACNLLLDKGYKVNFTIVGKIKDKNLYREIIRRDFIKYVNVIPKEKLINIYREHHIFVMPSITETFGLVYAEAMSQGLPVIYSRGQGFDRQFENGVVGYSVDCFNEYEITDRIVDILNRYEEISFNSLKYSSIFDWDNIAKLYITIYNNECESRA